MEVAISLTLVFKIFAFMLVSCIVAGVTLSPINDQDTSKTQFVVFAVIELVMLALIFGRYSVKFVA